MKVGFIGLGVMGKPCVNNLLKAGYEVLVWARRRESAQEVLAAGARWSDTPAELAAEVEVLITNVPNTIDVESVLLGPEGVVNGAKPGLVCADMSTISPIGARRIAEQLSEYGLEFLDCPVSGEAALMGGFASSKVLDIHGQRMIDDNFAPGFKAVLHQKDAGIILETARELGISLPESTRVAALVNELVARGEGDLDSSAI